MIEIGLGIAACVSIYKIAEADDESGLLWGGITVLLCYFSLYLPYPYLRFLLAAVAAFILMIVFKLIRDR
jgi:hypothetical protein